MNYRKTLIILVVITIGAFLFSCAPKERKPLSQLDTPEHHTYTGLKLMDQGKYDDAQREFELALQLNRKFSKAYAGMGLVSAYKDDFKQGFKYMDTAEDYAKSDDEKVFYHVGMVRLYTMAKPDDEWLDDAVDEFEDAVKIDPKSSAAYYYTGIAYKNALDFGNAANMFAKVLDLDDKYVREADKEWNLVQKIQRAMPGTVTGKKIALVESITRADIAALFMEELKIDELYKKRGVKTYDTIFKDPEKFKEMKDKPALTASDIGEHVLRSDIEGILHIGVRGLEVYPDGAFHPDDLINRAAYAMMIEDILIKVAGDRELATKYIGSISPFPDIRNDLPYFNAIMVVTSRGIMEAKEIATGEFEPLGSVSGADALLIIRKLKEELRFF
jgi:tetratricopeptide (TPR) repeat protein